MRYAALFLVALTLGAAAAAQEAGTDRTATRRQFRIPLEPLIAPGYAPAHELRLALFDSPMSRLELGAWREQLALRHPGPTGPIVPLRGIDVPFRLRFRSDANYGLILPGTARWRELDWADKVATGAELGLFTWALVEVLGHVH